MGHIVLLLERRNSMKLWEYVDKNVRLILEDGTYIKGRVVD
ncbi:conserved domain protein [Streptococcus mitis bv. 2 str. SK95]|uniref:Conserved domain protein n=1 Tax=Streptococcus mitis bv. 2 str. SK95 TaxID=1000588 RepID=F9LUN5_STROR|nr:conserved domain protein [Streptococcus mitis bv. 2 str. SK95]